MTFRDVLHACFGEVPVPEPPGEAEELAHLAKRIGVEVKRITALEAELVYLGEQLAELSAEARRLRIRVVL